MSFMQNVCRDAAQFCRCESDAVCCGSFVHVCVSRQDYQTDGSMSVLSQIYQCAGMGKNMEALTLESNGCIGQTMRELLYLARWERRPARGNRPQH